MHICYLMFWKLLIGFHLHSNIKEDCRYSVIWYNTILRITKQFCSEIQETGDRVERFRWLAVFFRLNIFPSVKLSMVRLPRISYCIYSCALVENKTNTTEQFTLSIDEFCSQYDVMLLSFCQKLPAKFFLHINGTEPFSVIVNGRVLRVLHHLDYDYDGT